MPEKPQVTFEDQLARVRELMKPNVEAGRQDFLETLKKRESVSHERTAEANQATAAEREKQKAIERASIIAFGSQEELDEEDYAAAEAVLETMRPEERMIFLETHVWDTQNGEFRLKKGEEKTSRKQSVR